MKTRQPESMSWACSSVQLPGQTSLWIQRPPMRGRHSDARWWRRARRQNTPPWGEDKPGREANWPCPVRREHPIYTQIPRHLRSPAVGQPTSPPLVSVPQSCSGLCSRPLPAGGQGAGQCPAVTPRLLREAGGVPEGGRQPARLPHRSKSSPADHASVA